MTSDGVGIGTTNPQGLLDVNQKLTVLSSGMVGIGSSTPAYFLDVVASSTTAIHALNGNNANPIAFAMGRAAPDMTIAIAGSGGQYSSSALQGDTVFRTESTGQRLLLQNGGGASALAVYGGNVGIGTTSPFAKLAVVGQVVSLLPSALAPTSSASQTIDFSTGNIQTLDLTSAENNITLTFANAVAGGSYAIKIIQGATARTVSWPAGTKWPGGTPITLSTSSGTVDFVTLFFDGTSYYAVGGNNFQ